MQLGGVAVRTGMCAKVSRVKAKRTCQTKASETGHPGGQSMSTGHLPWDILCKQGQACFTSPSVLLTHRRGGEDRQSLRGRNGKAFTVGSTPGSPGRAQQTTLGSPSAGHEAERNEPLWIWWEGTRQAGKQVLNLSDFSRLWGTGVEPSVLSHYSQCH